MVRLSLTLAFSLAFSACVIAQYSKEIAGKHAIIRRECVLAADAVRKIPPCSTTRCKLQLTAIVSDFLFNLQYALYALNNMIGRVDEENHKLLSFKIHKISNYCNDVQQALTGDTEALKEKLASVLEKTKKGIDQQDEMFKGAFASFENNQLRREHDFFIYAIYKLKHGALLFGKSNKELIPDMNSAQGLLVGNLNLTLASDNAIRQQEIRHAVEHIATLTERCTYKLNNWIQANSEDPHKESMAEVALAVSALFDREIRAVSRNLTTAQIKDELLSIYENGLGLARRVAEMDIENNVGTPEFIRSCLIDGVAVGNAYMANFQEVLA